MRDASLAYGGRLPGFTASAMASPRRHAMMGDAGIDYSMANDGVMLAAMFPTNSERVLCGTSGRYAARVLLAS